MSLSKPVLVGRSKDYFWFPQVQRLPSDELVAIIRTCADTWPFEDKSAVLWSSDRGMTWSKPHPYVGESFCQLVAPAGDLLLLPLMLYPRSGGVGGPYHFIPKGRREVERARDEMIVTGLPRQFLSPYPEQGAVAFLDGQTLKTKDGRYLAPIYGYFSQDVITEAQKTHDKNTTGYAELVAVNDHELLYIYDRIPNGWDPIPQDSPESFSVWVIQITLEKTR